MGIALCTYDELLIFWMCYSYIRKEQFWGLAHAWRSYVKNHYFIYHKDFFLLNNHIQENKELRRRDHLYIIVLDALFLKYFLCLCV